MKTIKPILTALIVFLLYSFADAQGNCPGDKIKVYKGATGCGCKCQKECVTPAELPTYIANGWNTTGCWNCCFGKNWVKAESSKTSLDEVYLNADSGSYSVSFTLESERDVKIRVRDLTGRYVATVADEFFEDEENELIWDSKDLSPGIYFLTMDTADYHDTAMFTITN